MKTFRRKSSQRPLIRSGSEWPLYLGLGPMKAFLAGAERDRPCLASFPKCSLAPEPTRTTSSRSLDITNMDKSETKPNNTDCSLKYSACCLVRPWMEELIPEKNSLEKIPKPLKRWMGRPQLLPEIVENVLRSLWWGNGSKQPSPCLQPPKVGGLLRHLLLLLKAPLTSLHF